MAGRDERVALNEARARLENEQREDWFGTHARVLFDCECYRLDCDAQISLSREEYERVRANPTHFAIRAGHIDETVEFVAERWDTYWVTEKGTPDGKRIAEETDPRS